MLSYPIKKLITCNNSRKKERLKFMKVTEINEDIILYGFTIRTKNSNEMTLSTAKIGPIWNKFFAEIAPTLEKSSKIYGLYSNYESDASGEFDLTACTDQKAYNSKIVTLKKGKYLVFSAKGVMPQVVIDTWGDIWNYFSNDSKYSRTYLTDFELYKSSDEIEIYIGIK